MRLLEILRKSLSLYKQHGWKIVWVGILLTIPLQLADLFVANYFYGMFDVLGLSFVGTLLATWFGMLFFCLIQPPYIEMAVQSMKPDGIRLGSIFQNTLTNLFPVYLLSLVYMLFVAVGTLLFVIPGLILLVWLFPVPYVVMIEGKTGWEGLKRSFQIGKNHFFRLAGLIFVFGAVQWLIQILALIGSLIIEERFIIIALIQIGLSTLIVPLFCFILTFSYVEWEEIFFDEPMDELILYPNR